jgi:hypothetical protein
LARTSAVSKPVGWRQSHRFSLDLFSRPILLAAAASAPYAEAQRYDNEIREAYTKGNAIGIRFGFALGLPDGAIFALYA